MPRKPRPRIPPLTFEESLEAIYTLNKIEFISDIWGLVPPMNGRPSMWVLKAVMERLISEGMVTIEFALPTGGKRAVITAAGRARHEDLSLPALDLDSI